MYNKKTSFADFIVKEVCPENKFLEEMNKVIPWHEIENWSNKKVVKKNIKVGRPSYPVIMMFKIHLIQQW